jgi:hypothetical protein
MRIAADRTSTRTNSLQQFILIIGNLISRASPQGSRNRTKDTGLTAPWARGTDLR